MNGDQHELMTELVGELLRLPRDVRAAMAHGSSAPDHAVDVFVRLPTGEKVTRVLGREVAALKHFLPGFCWQDDPSLSVLEELGDVGTKVLGMTVSGDSVPMIRACRAQPGRTLCEFRFPSAADVAGYFAAVADGDPFIVGELLHMVQDCCQPHHALGKLLGGHQHWEDQSEAFVRQHVEMLLANREIISDTLGKAVAAEKCTGTCVEELCRQNADWARAWFRNKDISECGLDDALAVFVRAISSSIAAVNLVTKGNH